MGPPMGSPTNSLGLPGALLGSLGLFGAPRALKTLTISTIILTIITILITIITIIITIITIIITIVDDKAGPTFVTRLMGFALSPFV